MLWSVQSIAVISCDVKGGSEMRKVTIRKLQTFAFVAVVCDGQSRHLAQASKCPCLVGLLGGRSSCPST